MHVHRSQFAALILIFILALGVVLVSVRNHRKADVPKVGPQKTERLEPGADRLPTRTNQGAEWQASITALRSSSGSEQSKNLLNDVRRRLAAMPANEAAVAIRELLDSGADQPTQLGFVVSSSGFLDEAPTLRVFLLDQLMRIDPVAAATYAEKILRTHGSADEWAVSMRAYAKRDLDANQRQYLQGKIRELMHHRPWQSNPSTGYLEAFDVAVYLKSPELVPDLTSLVREKDNRAAAHAAYLALDRLVLERPADVLRQLHEHPGQMAGREVTRANYFARADLRDPAQKIIVQDYLLDPTISPAERAAFAGLFPSGNYMVSHNLLSSIVTPNGEEIRSRDQTALRTVTDWLQDPKFAHRRSELARIKMRLESFVGGPGRPSGN